MATKAKKKTAKKRKLGMTARASRFCHEFVKCGVKLQAAKAAGYSPKTAHAQASALLKNPKVIEKIADLRSRMIEKIDLSAERVLEEYKKIAFTNLTDVVDMSSGSPVFRNLKDIPAGHLGALRSISETKDGLKIQMHDKKGALDSLSKHLGLFAEDNKRQIQMQVGEITKEDAEFVKGIFDDITE